MGTSMRIYIGRVSMIVTAAAAIAGAVASVSTTGPATSPADTHWIGAEGACPDDMHWSVDLGRCIATVPGDMHW